MYLYGLTEQILQIAVTRDAAVPDEAFRGFAVDLPVSDVFGASPFRDVLAPDENGGGARRDLVTPLGAPGSALGASGVPAEFSSGAAITLDATPPLEWAQGAASSTTGLAGWRGGVMRDAAAPAFWLGPFAVSGDTQVEWGLVARASSASPIDPGTTRLAATFVASERRAALRRDASAPAEPDAVAAWSPVVPVDWQSLTSVRSDAVPLGSVAALAADRAAPAEPLVTAARGNVVPVDWSQPAQSAVSVSVGAEFTSRIFEFRPNDIDFGAGKFWDRATPVEWTGDTGTTLDVDGPVEWRGGLASDGAAPTAWRATFAGDATTPVEPEASPSADAAGDASRTADLGRDAAAPVEWRLALVLSSITPVAWRSTLVEDAVVPVAYTGSATGATGDAEASLEFGVGRVSDAVAPHETGSSSASDAPAPAAWQGGTRADRAATLEAATTGAVDAAAPLTASVEVAATRRADVDWSFTGVTVSARFVVEAARADFVDAPFSVTWRRAALSPDADTLIEWGHETLAASGDAFVPLDFVSLGAVDIVVDLGIGFERGSIGASLEPDEWEREHG